MREPVLRARTIPSGYNRRINLTMRVQGGLHHIKGNRKPYFTLTTEVHRKGHPNQCQSGGCDHETILKYYPELADLAALHLCDIEGVPMHGDANGWYYLAAVLPEHAGEKYHAGTSQRSFPKLQIDPAKPWDKTDYRLPTRDESLQSFADHVRLPIDAVRKLAEEIEQAALDGIEARKLAEEAGYASAGVFSPLPRYDWKVAREVFNGWIESQKPRWAAEAKACIEKHGLKVFGDPWPTEVNNA